MIFKETEKIFSRIPVGAKGLKKRQKLRMIKEKKNHEFKYIMRIHIDQEKEEAMKMQTD